MPVVRSTGLRPVLVRYQRKAGGSRYLKKKKPMPSFFASKKKAGATPATGFLPSRTRRLIKPKVRGRAGAQRRIKPYTKVKRKKKQGGKRPKRVTPYRRLGGACGCHKKKAGSLPTLEPRDIFTKAKGYDTSHYTWQGRN